jgi:hypothetical protein
MVTARSGYPRRGRKTKCQSGIPRYGDSLVTDLEAVSISGQARERAAVAHAAGLRYWTLDTSSGPSATNGSSTPVCGN